MILVGRKAKHILPISVNCWNVPGNLGFQLWKLGKNEIKHRLQSLGFRGILRGEIFIHYFKFWRGHEIEILVIHPAQAIFSAFLGSR
jgi:hypothetical protein